MLLWCPACAHRPGVPANTLQARSHGESACSGQLPRCANSAHGRVEQLGAAARRRFTLREGCGGRMGRAPYGARTVSPPQSNAPPLR